MVSGLFQRHQSLYLDFKNVSSSQIMGGIYQSLSSEDDKTKQVSPRQKRVLTQTYSYLQGFHRNYVKELHTPTHRLLHQTGIHPGQSTLLLCYLWDIG